MTLHEIKAAVESGKDVYWKNPGYRVVKDSIGQWLIRCTWNGQCTGLTRLDGVTMNEAETYFHVLDDKDGAQGG